jgi:putative transposase
LPISRQCQLLDIGRSSYYYQAVPVSQADVDLMRVIDERAGLENLDTSEGGLK